MNFLHCGKYCNMVHPKYVRYSFKLIWIKPEYLHSREVGALFCTTAFFFKGLEELCAVRSLLHMTTSNCHWNW